MRIPNSLRLGTSLVAMFALAVIAVGCGGREAASLTPTQSPAEVSLTITLTTPNAGDGAVLFTVAGPSILGVTARPGLEMTESSSSDNGRTTSTILIRGNLTSGPIGSLTVRGADAGAAYTTEVRQVAAGASGGYALRADLTTYRLAMRR